MFIFKENYINNIIMLSCWLNKNPDIEIFLRYNKMTMFQIQKLYNFAFFFFY